MPTNKIRFVTACQQVLALAAVLAVLTPAANVISLDVVHDRRETGFVTPERAVDLRSHTRDARRAARDETPGAGRARHVQARGWSDPGYRVLVDRFGTGWAGQHRALDQGSGRGPDLAG